MVEGDNNVSHTSTSIYQGLWGGATGLTFGAEASSDVGFRRGDVGKPQSALVKVLIGEEMSEADVGGFPRDVHTELLWEDGEQRPQRADRSNASDTLHITACSTHTKLFLFKLNVVFTKKPVFTDLNLELVSLNVNMDTVTRWRGSVSFLWLPLAASSHPKRLSPPLDFPSCWNEFFRDPQESDTSWWWSDGRNAVSR